MSIQVRSNEKPVVAAPEAKAEGSLSQVSQKAETSAPEAEASEQNDASESETEEQEDHGESDESDAGREHETDNENEAKEKPKKKGGFQRRIDKLNARHTQTQQELEYWKKMAMENAGSSKKEQVDSPKPAAAEGKPNPDKFDTHAEYVEALADWKTEQKLKERDQKAENDRLKTEQAKVVESYNQKAQAFAKTHPDFNEVLADVDGIEISVTIRQSLLESENGPALAYELAKNIDELERINALGPIAAAREIGKIEARIAAKSSDQKSESKKLTNAPKPIAPVKAGSATVKKSISDPSLSQAEYERLRMEQIKKRR